LRGLYVFCGSLCIAPVVLNHHYHQLLSDVFQRWWLVNEHVSLVLRRLRCQGSCLLSHLQDKWPVSWRDYGIVLVCWHVGHLLLWVYSNVWKFWCFVLDSRHVDGLLHPIHDVLCQLHLRSCHVVRTLREGVVCGTEYTVMLCVMLGLLQMLDVLSLSVVVYEAAWTASCVWCWAFCRCWMSFHYL
jgi:hypothetical protein